MILLELAIILFFGIWAQWLGWRFGTPALLFFLCFGLLLGPVTHAVHAEAIPEGFLAPAVALSVAVILFAGSLNLNFKDLRANGAIIVRLLALGYVTAATGIALGAHFLLGLDWRLAVLLGAVLAVTGPTAVIPVLKNLRLQKDLSTIMYWEAIAVDPLGALAAILVFQAIGAEHVEHAVRVFALGLVRTAALGTLLGLAAAFGLARLMRRFWLGYSLQSVGALTTLVVAFTAATLLQNEATGFFTVTVMGLALANQRDVSIRHIVEFKENLSLLLIPILFITLSARVSWEQFRGLEGPGVLFVFFLLLLVRPASVGVATLGTRLSWRERLFLAGQAPRGIVAVSMVSVFAGPLAQAGYTQAGALVPLAVLTVIGSVLAASLGAVPLARALGVAGEKVRGVLLFGIHDFSLRLAQLLQVEGVPVLLVDSDEVLVGTAQARGLTVVAGDVFSDRLREHPDLWRYTGQFLALTHNDEANSLAVLHFQTHFERSDLYQLPRKQALGVSMECQPDPHLRGRYLFAPHATWEWLDHALRQGGRLRTIRLATAAEAEAFAARRVEGLLPLAFISAKREIRFLTPEIEWQPRAGQTVLVLEPGAGEERGTIHRWWDRVVSFAGRLRPGSKA